MIRETLSRHGFVVEDVLGDVGTRALAIAHDPKGRRVLVTAFEPHPDAAWTIGDVEEPLLPLVDSLEIERISGDPWQIVTEALPVGSSSLHPRWVASAPHLVPKFSLALAELVAERESRAIIFRETHPALVFVVPEPPWVIGFGQRSLPLLSLRHPMSIDEAGPVLDGWYGAPEADRGPTLVGDAFHLAAILWRWRRGRVPFTRDLDGLNRRRTGEARGAPRDAIDRLFLECFQPRTLDRPALPMIADALRDEARGSHVPPSATAGERVRTMVRHLRESGLLAHAEVALEIETTLEGDASMTAWVSMTKPDGFGEAYKFSGDPDSVKEALGRRVKTSRVRPDESTKVALRERRARAEAASTPMALPASVAERKELFAELTRRTRACVGSPPEALRSSHLGTNVSVELEATTTVWADLESVKESHVLAVVVKVHHRMEGSGPPRLYGEESTSNDAWVLAEQRFDHVPSEAELREAVRRSWEQVASGARF